MVQIAVLCKANSFCLHLQLSPFCIKVNPRENRFLRPGGRLVSCEGSHNVKILTEKRTNFELTG